MGQKGCIIDMCAVCFDVSQFCKLPMGFEGRMHEIKIEMSTQNVLFVLCSVALHFLYCCTPVLLTLGYKGRMLLSSPS